MGMPNGRTRKQMKQWHNVPQRRGEAQIRKPKIATTVWARGSVRLLHLAQVSVWYGSVEQLADTARVKEEGDRSASISPAQ